MATLTVEKQVEIDEIWKSYKADPTNKEYRNLLVEQYLPLVKYNGERIWARLPDGVELDDLISAGVFGLMDAIDAFDMTRGVKFETYCVPRIRGAMLDELRTMDWVPRLVRSKHSKLEEIRNTPTPFSLPRGSHQLSAGNWLVNGMIRCNVSPGSTITLNLG